jgi:hypothetical protein
MRGDMFLVAHLKITTNGSRQRQRLLVTGVVSLLGMTSDMMRHGMLEVVDAK